MASEETQGRLERELTKVSERLALLTSAKSTVTSSTAVFSSQSVRDDVWMCVFLRYFASCFSLFFRLFVLV